MGCDIHSRAEIRIDGKWQILGDVFPNTSSMRWVPVTRELLDTLDDGNLIDLVDMYVKSRQRDGDREPCRSVLEIPEGSELEKKILTFAEKFHEKMEWGRTPEGREVINRDENGDYDNDGWARFIIAAKSAIVQNLALTDEEREQIKQAALNFRQYTPEEWTEDYGDRYGDYDTSEDNLLTFTEQRLRDDDTAPPWLHNEPLDSRNYTLFAWLANVRNDGTVEPLAEPKGSYGSKFDKEKGEWIELDGATCPEDSSPEVKQYSRRMGLDGHSHSWFTLREFQEADLDGEVKYKGLVTVGQFEAMKRKGWPGEIGCGPSSWAGGIGSGVVFSPEAYEKWVAINRPHVEERGKDHYGFVETANVLPSDLPDEVQPVTLPVDTWLESVENLTYEHVLKLQGVDDDYASLTGRDARYVWNNMRPHVYAEWYEKKREQLGKEFEAMIEVFERLVEEHGITPDDIRVVFYFDN